MLDPAEVKRVLGALESIASSLISVEESLYIISEQMSAEDEQCLGDSIN